MVLVSNLFRLLINATSCLLANIGSFGSYICYFTMIGAKDDYRTKRAKGCWTSEANGRGITLVAEAGGTKREDEGDQAGDGRLFLEVIWRDWERLGNDREI